MKISLIVLSIFFNIYTLATSELNDDEGQFDFSGIMKLLQEDDQVMNPTNSLATNFNPEQLIASNEAEISSIGQSSLRSQGVKEDFDKILPDTSNFPNLGFTGQDLNQNSEEIEGLNARLAFYKSLDDSDRPNFEFKRIKELQEEVQKLKDIAKANMNRPRKDKKKVGFDPNKENEHDFLSEQKEKTFESDSQNSIESFMNLNEEKTANNEIIVNKKKNVNVQTTPKTSQNQEKGYNATNPMQENAPFNSALAYSQNSALDSPSPSTPKEVPIDRKQKISNFNKQKSCSRSIDLKCLKSESVPDAIVAPDGKRSEQGDASEEISESSQESSEVSCNCSLCEAEEREKASSSSCIDSDGLEALEEANLDIEEEVASFQKIVRSKFFLKRLMKDHYSYITNPENHMKVLQEKDAKKLWTKRKKFLRQHYGKLAFALVAAIGTFVFGLYR
jgi:hypothetical protein